MKKERIMVIGSSNTDMVTSSKNLPSPGETVLGNKFIITPGGKGANQAVAASRAGAEVLLVAKIGDDMFGKETLKNLKKEKIRTDCIFIHKHAHSGVALIMIDENGENLISVAPEANGLLKPSDIKKAKRFFQKTKIMLIQLEIPYITVEKSILLAKQSGTKVLLNPAPAPSKMFSNKILRNIDYLTPNMTELERLAGSKIKTKNDIIKSGKRLLKRGIKNIVITMGNKGVLILNNEIERFVPPFKVKPIDTVGAGDCFSGVLSVGLAEGKNLETAVRFASAAAAISVTRIGAQTSLPYRNEIEKFAQKRSR